MRGVEPLPLPASPVAPAGAAAAALPLLAERRVRPRAARKPQPLPDPVVERPASFLQAELADHQALFAHLAGLDPLLCEAGERLSACLSAGGKLLICGNGGSAVEAQRLAATLAGMGQGLQRPLAALALGAEGVSISGHACRQGFEGALARQVQALGRAGDALLLLHAGGSARNLGRAARQAFETGMLVVGLLGALEEDAAPELRSSAGAGGKGCDAAAEVSADLAACCHLSLRVPGHSTARLEEAHAFLGHVLSGLIQRNLGLG